MLFSLCVARRSEALGLHSLLYLGSVSIRALCLLPRYLVLGDAPHKAKTNKCCPPPVSNARQQLCRKQQQQNSRCPEALLAGQASTAASLTSSQDVSDAFIRPAQQAEAATNTTAAACRSKPAVRCWQSDQAAPSNQAHKCLEAGWHWQQHRCRAAAPAPWCRQHQGAVGDASGRPLLQGRAGPCRWELSYVPGFCHSHQKGQGCHQDRLPDRGAAATHRLRGRKAPHPPRPAQLQAVCGVWGVCLQPTLRLEPPRQALRRSAQAQAAHQQQHTSSTPGASTTTQQAGMGWRRCCGSCRKDIAAAAAAAVGPRCHQQQQQQRRQCCCRAVSSTSSTQRRQQRHCPSHN